MAPKLRARKLGSRLKVAQTASNDNDEELLAASAGVAGFGQRVCVYVHTYTIQYHIPYASACVYIYIHIQMNTNYFLRVCRYIYTYR